MKTIIDQQENQCHDSIQGHTCLNRAGVDCKLDLRTRSRKHGSGLSSAICIAVWLWQSDTACPSALSVHCHQQSRTILLLVWGSQRDERGRSTNPRDRLRKRCSAMGGRDPRARRGGSGQRRGVQLPEAERSARLGSPLDLLQGWPEIVLCRGGKTA